MSAEIELAETSSSMEDAIKVLKRLANHDTHDKVAQAARDALEDARDYLEDVIFSLADGLLEDAS